MSNVFEQTEYVIKGDAQLAETPPSPGGGFNPDSLSTDTADPVDADIFITKKNSDGNWYQKTFEKIWDWIKTKLGISSQGSAGKYLNEQGSFITPSVGVKSISTSGNDLVIDTDGTISTVTVPYAQTAYNATYAGHASTADGATTASKDGDGNIISTTYVPRTEYPTGTRYGTTGSTTYIKININSTSSWMLAFTVHLYQGYRETSVRISGYQYGSNHWYEPEATVISDSNNNKNGSSAANYNNGLLVYFGYDGTNKLWVAFAGGSYTGVSISDVTNGYTQISNYTGLFSISNVSSVSAQTSKYAVMIPSHIGEIIMSTTLSSLAAVRQVYGTDTTWIQHSGYMLRGATSGVTAGSASYTGGADSVTVSSVASHKHDVQAVSIASSGGHQHALPYNGVGGNGYVSYKLSTTKEGDTALSGGDHTHTVPKHTTDNKGANYTVNTLSKYKSIYIWERTA